MKILITGGAGFIGSHLCEKYVQEGCTVVCLDNFMNGNLGNIRTLLNHRNFKLVNGDIRDVDLLEKIVPGVNVIVHLAAQIHVDRSIIEPKLTYDINVTGTLNILELARKYDIEKVAYASTSEVYGPALYSPMDEDHPLIAPHPYGASKIAADRMCSAYIKTYGMNIFIVRSFNAFGPKQKESGYGGAISIFVKRALNNQPPLIYGDGTQTRDYLYVKDLVDAYSLIIKSNVESAAPINFGTGQEIRISDLANKIIELCGKQGQLKPVYIGARPGEVARLIANYSKANKLLSWEPKYSLEQGLMEYIDWYKNYRLEEWTKPG